MRPFTRSPGSSTGPRARSRYDIPLALGAFKLPLGAFTAVTGLLLLNGDFVPGFSYLDSQGQVLAYALVFGYAQQLVSRLVDQHVHKLVSHLPVSSPIPDDDSESY